MAKGGYQKRRIAEKKQREREARKRAERRKKLLTGLIVLVLLGLTGGIVVIATGGDGDLAANGNSGCSTPGEAGAPKETYASAPEDVLADDIDYTATLVTSCGIIEVDLLEDAAPATVNNFVFLARDGYYDNTIFHRVIAEFAGSAMIQGGDAVNFNGTGGPGYQFIDENMIPFAEPGYLAMANSGPGTNGSQFFILDGTVSHLNADGACPPEGASGCHSVFGQVTSGLDVIGRIANVETEPGDKPVNDVVLISVTIQETPAA